MSGRYQNDILARSPSLFPEFTLCSQRQGAVVLRTWHTQGCMTGRWHVFDGHHVPIPHLLKAFSSQILRLSFATLSFISIVQKPAETCESVEFSWVFRICVCFISDFCFGIVTFFPLEEQPQNCCVVGEEYSLRDHPGICSVFKMGIEDVLSKAKESSHQVTPKKYKMFLASVPVEGVRKYLDVTNKFTGDVGSCSSPLRTSKFHPIRPLFQFLQSLCE